MEWDEGPPDPRYFQSNRIDRYREAARQLLREGKAYPCYCTAEELDAKRKAAEREHRKPGYDGTCRELDFPAGPRAAGQGRPQLYDPVSRPARWSDRRRGSHSKGRDGFSRIASSTTSSSCAPMAGRPTTSATVLDDVDFNITHVVRGDDHVPNTPRQMQMSFALGYKPPAFAHLPLVMGPDGGKLSKRHGATSVIAYREMGYFPEAVLNYLARLGWSHGDQEIFSKQELIEYFGFDACGKSGRHFQRREVAVAELPLPEGAAAAATRGGGQTIHREARIADSRRRRVAGEDARDAAGTRQDAGRAGRFREFYLSDDIDIDAKAAAKFLKPEVTEPTRRAWPRSSSRLEGDFSEASMQAVFEDVLAQLQPQARPARATGARRADRRHRQSRNLRSHRGARPAPHCRSLNAAAACRKARRANRPHFALSGGSTRICPFISG